MTLEDRKFEMKKYRDFYGSELSNYSEIDNCKSLIECDILIERHRTHMEDMLSDAQSHLDNLRQRIHF